jgi:hypothetical protein
MKSVLLAVFIILSYSCSSNDELIVLGNGVHFYRVSSPEMLNNIDAGYCNDIALRAFDKSGFAICHIDVTNIDRQCPQGIRCEGVEYGFVESKLSYIAYNLDEDGWIKLSDVSSKSFGDPEISESKHGASGTMAAVVITRQSWGLGDKVFSLSVMTHHDQNGYVESESYISSVILNSNAKSGN